MKKIKGVSVSGGVAIGKVQIINQNKLVIKRHNIDKFEVEEELRKFEDSIEHVVEEIDLLIENISQSKVNKDILEAHKMILKDPDLTANIKKSIKTELLSLEKAIKLHFTDVIELFDNMENDYLSTRSSDYEDVAYRLLSHVLKQNDHLSHEINENAILVMNKISPSMATKVFKKQINGLCMEKGSKNSHSSIIARSMNLPMIVNVESIIDAVKDEDLVILNGNNGDVIVHPDDATIQKYRELVAKQDEEKSQLLKVVDLPTKTKDNKKIPLMSNIEIPDEIQQVRKVKSEGIGLFRTEFLFMGTNKLPIEEEQFEIYKKVAEECYPNPLVIRTIDIGGDKLTKLLNIEHEVNPNLGCRGIRISLKYDLIFKQQIKAILRANLKGNIKIMFPMISCVAEIKKSKKIIQECIDELKVNKIKHNPNIKIGAMIEIPSAAITSDLLAKECDFLSIGTNDLVQYTMAVDRDNASLSEYYQPSHLSVLRLIKMTIENAHKENIKVALCGEMASEKKYIKLLIGLDVDELSVSPGRFLMVKKEILNTNYEAAAKLDEKIFHALVEV